MHALYFWLKGLYYQGSGQFDMLAKFAYNWDVFTVAYKTPFKKHFQFCWIMIN